MSDVNSHSPVSLEGEKSSVPVDWKIARIEEIAETVGGSTPKSGESTYWDGEIPWATPTDLTGLSSYRISKTERYITQLGLENCSATLLPKNSLLVTSRATIGHVAINDIPMATNQGFINLILNNGSDPQFLAYVLEQKRADLERLAAGSTFLELSKSAFRKFVVPYPDYREQQKIVAILSSIDEALEASQAVLEQLQETKRGLIQRLFKRGLEGGSADLYKTSLGNLPTSWEVAKLKDACRRITDGVHQAVKTDRTGSVPFLYVSCIQPSKIVWDNTARISSEAFTEISKGREPNEDVILYTAVGSYGNAVLLLDDSPLAFQRHIAYIAVDRTKAVPKFVEGWLNSPFANIYADRVAVGNAQKTVTLNALSNFPIPLPPVDEQKEIAQVVSSFDKRVDCEKAKKAQLEVVKRGLMQQLLTGKLRVAV